MYLDRTKNIFYENQTFPKENLIIANSDSCND